VLNAFRHHRGGHVPARLGRIVRPRVLNAFRHHRGGHKSSLGAFLCAVIVLNAFRHHRGGHLVTDDGHSAIVNVLNAFRHHRGGHVLWSPSGNPPYKCSTPFGITEVGMDEADRILVLEGSAQRLSASQRWASLWLD